jgi:hypothetical protein
MTDGSAYCWGFGTSRTLGHSATDDAFMYRNPAPLAGNHRFTKLIVRDLLACGLTVEGRIFC